MRSYDLHNHTSASRDSNLEPEELVNVAIKSNLDGIAITNHNTVADIDRARNYAGDKIDIISGVEVTSDDHGDILCLFIDEIPENNGTSRDIIRSVHNQNGLAILAHPFAYRTGDFRDATADTIKSADAIEAINSRNVIDKLNDKAFELASDYNMPVTGGSDTHFYFESGRSRTLIPDNYTIREAIEDNETKAVGWGDMSSHIARLVMELGGDLK